MATPVTHDTSTIFQDLNGISAQSDMTSQTNKTISMKALQFRPLLATMEKSVTQYLPVGQRVSLETPNMQIFMTKISKSPDALDRSYISSDNNLKVLFPMSKVP